MHVTQRFAATFVDELAEAGLRDVCISPGSRSAPLAIAFARHPAIRVLVHIDERSGSFFGLGLAKASGRPVALLCTSGTAAAEFHPAVIEAFHSQTRLLVLTADRPPELRDVGANQAVDQAHLYGSAVRWFFDPGPPDDGMGARAWRRLARRALTEALGPPAGPVHLNLPLREPLTPPAGERPQAEPAGVASAVFTPVAQPTAHEIQHFGSALESSLRPLLVAGSMRDGGRLASTVAGLAEAGVPVLAEPTSQLRLPGTVASYEALLRDEAWAAEQRPDLVIRIGATPTSKPLNQWLAAEPLRTLLVDPERAWSDPDLLATDVFRCDPLPLLAGVRPRSRFEWAAEWAAADRAAGAALDETLGGGPLHEGAVARALARGLPAGATLFVGSSMPIRAVDAFWPASADNPRFLANRGASGIDGLVSTGLGVAAASAGPAVLLLGDLSVYHDMNGLLALGRHGVRATLVVLDNGGGGIFGFLPQAEHEDVFEELFLTPLGLRFDDIARLYGLDYAEVGVTADLEKALVGASTSPRSVLLRVAIKLDDSIHGHRACWAAVSAAIRSARPAAPGA
jgi:2-succinyl-5-enolpyruvyl-6-hydroxy-3-cyclohexene-1-carboxylate synthase